VFSRTTAIQSSWNAMNNNSEASRKLFTGCWTLMCVTGDMRDYWSCFKAEHTEAEIS
jgi:hypothetical protein